MGINVVMKDLPNTIKAYTVPNTDGTFTIFINSRLNLDQQQSGYIHELQHIINGDFDTSEDNVNFLEVRAHFA